MRLGLWMAALFVSICADAQEISLEYKSWSETHVPIEFVREFISNEKCAADETYQRSCVNAVREAARLVDAEVVEVSDFEAELARLESLLPSDIPVQMLRAYAINGQMQTYDSYAYLRPSSEYRDAWFEKSKAYVGIGANVQTGNMGFVVMEAYENSPAEAAGLQAGDLVLAVDSVSVEGRDFDFLVRQIKGEPGSALKMRVRRGSSELELEIVRGSVDVSPFEFEVTDGTAYVRLRNFDGMSPCSQVDGALLAMKEEGVHRLIFDLRGNRGGDTDVASCIGSLFVGPRRMFGMRPLDQSVPYTRQYTVSGLDAGVITYEMGTEAVAYDGDMVVLVDSQTASSAEFLAGALQDYGRAWVVGEQTFGKGSVQVAINMLENSTLSLSWTTAQFFTPSGRSPHQVGITPNFRVMRRVGLDAAIWETRRTPAGLVWTESRMEDVLRIEACVSKGVQSLDASGDHQKSFAAAVLKCSKP